MIMKATVIIVAIIKLSVFAGLGPKDKKLFLLQSSTQYSLVDICFPKEEVTLSAFLGQCGFPPL